ncbi:MAG: hypothetical protein LH485_07890 [Sphingomonas bacterium]|nr:hypothetical protein [Sphingomonas bacterium]
MLTELDVAALTQDHGEPVDRAPTHDTAGSVPGPRYSESSSFGFPGWIWKVFFGSYAVFFAALALATARDGHAVFVVVVSVLYTVMFFGTAAVLQGLGKGKPRGFECGEPMLDTWTGRMSTASVAAQVLTIPILFAFFAIAIFVIRAIIGF